MAKIRMLSRIQRRSMNSQILFILENGLKEYAVEQTEIPVCRDLQLQLWKDLSGKWEDERDTEEIMDEIYALRSRGRNVTL